MRLVKTYWLEMLMVIPLFAFTRSSSFLVLTFHQGESGSCVDRSSSRQRACTILPRETARPATVILLYDVLAVDVRGKPSIQSPWYCHSSDCPWGPLWCLKSLHPL